MALIWEDAFLARLAADGEQDMVNRVACLFYRFNQAVTANTSVYTLPVKTSRIRRVTWLGIKLDPITFNDLCMMHPTFVWEDSTNKVDIPTGQPQYYVLHPTNINDIRFFPCPIEDVPDDAKDPYGEGIDTNIVISCFRNVDGTNEKYQLPDYIYRRAIKAYVLWKAYGAEGKGQSLKASGYYKQKYEYYVGHFDKLNSDSFVSKRYSLNASLPGPGGPGRPVLPARFGVD